MPPKKPAPKLEQAAFDEAVKTNLEDFGMEAEEAISSAVEEFELQGYDLSQVIKSATGGNTADHPIGVSTRALADAVAAGGESTSAAALEAALTQLQGQLQAHKDKLQEAFVVATKEGTIAALLSASQHLQADASAAGTDTQQLCLALLRQLMPSEALREAFAECGGPQAMQALLQQLLGRLGGDQQQQQLQPSLLALAGTVAALAEAASNKDEDNKCRFMHIGFGTELLQLLQRPDLPPAATAAACDAIRSFTSADDERPPASKAFLHARLLAKNDSALKVLLGVLQRLGPREPQAAAAALAAVRAVAANDEICREFSDDGGVLACLQLLRGGGSSDGDAGSSGSSSAELARAACAALRQLANSDAVKEQLAEAGALEDIVRLLHAGNADARDEGALEPALGLLTAMMLRQPGICTKAAASGCIEALLEVLSEKKGGGAVQRQACMAVRNMVVRNPELRPLFLEKGAEALLRGAKAAWPGACKEAGSAALRDLGLDKYND